MNDLEPVTDINSSKGSFSTTLLLREYIKALIAMSDFTSNFSLFRLIFGRESQKEADLRGQQIALLRELTDAGIDVQLFDNLVANELDRKLKRQFGAAFLTATVFFTLLSYAVVLANGYYKLGISDLAITALIIETPIQFIGLLYIIARNLFPNAVEQKSALTAAKKRTKPDKKKESAVSE